MKVLSETNIPDIKAKVPKLYEGYGTNTDGSITQNFINTKLNDTKLALGAETNASGVQSTALGVGAKAKGHYSTALGRDAIAGKDSDTEGRTINSAVAIGSEANATGQMAISIGHKTTATQPASIAIGKEAKSNGGMTVAVGYQAEAAVNGTLAFGGQASAKLQGDTAIGLGAQATLGLGTAIGFQSSVTGIGGFALGVLSKSTQENALAIGTESQSTNSNSIALGAGAKTTRAAEVSLGGAVTSEAGFSYPVTRVLSNVTAGSLNTDAVNVKQMQDYVTEHTGAPEGYDALKTKVDGLANIKTVNTSLSLSDAGELSTNLYSDWGNNEDGSLTQKFLNSKLNATDIVKLGNPTYLEDGITSGIGIKGYLGAQDGIAIGGGVAGERGIGLGGACMNKMSVTIGADSGDSREYEVSIGWDVVNTGYPNGLTRYLANVRAGEKPHDAVNLEQLNAKVGDIDTLLQALDTGVGV